MLTLFPKEKEKIIEFVTDNPNKEVRVRELAKQLNLSPAYISRTLKILKKHGMFKNNKTDLSNPYVRSLKIFLNVRKLVEKNVVEMLKKVKASVGIYGSWASGTNDEDSDLDVWIKFDKHPGEMKVASIANDIRKALGRNVQILVLSQDRIERLKNEDPTFYYSLVFGSILICGEPIE